MKVTLDEESEASLKEYIFEITKEAVKAASEPSIYTRTFLRKKHMAEFLGISTATLDNWVKKGCPKNRIDDVSLFNKEAVEKWILKH